MKVRVAVTLDVDPEAWTLTYGVEGPAAIRADVQAYATSMLTEHFRDQGVLTP